LSLPMREPPIHEDLGESVMDRQRPCVTVAIPCRADEPGLGFVVDEVLSSCRGAAFGEASAVELLVCINGVRPTGECAPLTALRTRLAAHAIPLSEVSVESAGWPQPTPVRAGMSARVFLTGVEGKAHAWNVLRGACAGDPVFMCDADVTFSPDAFARLHAGLCSAPHLALYSPKTDCRHDARLLERIISVPYRVDFPNLSGQLYAMHPEHVPARMPEDLIEPERWLELEVGPERVGRDPEARVYVRLTATLADFFRQRVRIEMGKIQLYRVYPHLVERSAPQPGRSVVWKLTPRERGALVVYLALRSVAHAWAWWRYRRGDVQGIWRQPVTTKRWATTP